MKHLITALTLATATAFGASGELKTQAKQILEANQDAIVWLSVIVKQDISAEGEAASKIPPGAFGGGKDQKVEATGTVVDASGLIVASLGNISTAGMLDGQEIETPVGTVKLKTKTEIKEVKVITADGTEIPADVVMKDVDLDLAFFKIRADSPEAKGVTFKSVDLKNNTTVSVLDDVVVLGRMGADMNRQPMAYTSEVLGLVKKPREFISVQTLSQGIPVFTPDGKTVGISIIRKPAGGVKLNAGTAQMRPAVLPAKDVLKVAEQAKNAKPEEKKDDAKKEEPKKDDGKKDAEKK
jgi:hypothetical protein